MGAIMASILETTAEMDALEEDAFHVLTNPDLTSLERRLALERLLRRYGVLDDYRRALAAYVRRMSIRQTAASPSPPDYIVGEILSSPEFTGLRFALLAALIAVIYGDGPRAAWVPTMLMPVMAPPTLRW